MVSHVRGPKALNPTIQVKELDHTDRISELPDALLLEILSFLPMTDVVVIMVLSKRWKFLWMFVPRLVYDRNMYKAGDERRSSRFLYTSLMLQDAKYCYKGKYLKQRAKIHWLKVGDSNNSYFHKVIKERQARNAIKEIKNQEGTLLTDQQEVKEEAARFFEEFLNHSPQDYTGISVEELRGILDFSCSMEEANSLIADVTSEEIQKTLFKMPSNKSPGPDGYTVEFYKAAWGVIGHDFTLAVKAFFTNGFLPKGMNSTILALVYSNVRVY